MSARRFPTAARALACAFAALGWGVAAVAGPAGGAANDWVPRAPDSTARSYLLMDYHSGAILAEKNAGEAFEPASLTKLMTAYVTYRALADGRVAPDDEALVSEAAWRAPGSRMFIEVGRAVALSDLIAGVVIQSGNDASIALAEHVAGSEETFVDMMNETADALGMEGSNFVNTSGLPATGHYMTAYDVAKLSQALIRDFPRHYALYAERSFTYAGITQHNRNKLLWRGGDLGVDGLKTGHTQGAGYCLAASARQGDMRLIAVVLGSTSSERRFRQSAELLRYGFRFYQTARLFERGQALERARVWGGADDHAELVLAQDFYATWPKVSGTRIRTELSVQEDVEAPVARHQQLGTARAFFGDRLLHEAPLVAAMAVPEGGLFTRIGDGFMRLFE